MLRAHGANVVGPIGDLGEALEQARRDGFDLAVIDINLRDEKAFPIADELPQQKTPFVFATGYRENVIPDRYRDVPRWEKPYELDRVIKDLTRLWANRS